jgi:serine/threonine protein kinase
MSLESLVAHLSEEFTERWKRGESFSVEEYVARHPQHAGVIRNLFTSLQFMHLAGADSLGPVVSPETKIQPQAALGDFRIVREIGRGGMGVVYEAEQISLGRRVALKVLPFASTLDPKQLQRFKNEAQAAGHLHHTNIVPVYATGCERGVHYYAMEFIDGQTLAQVIAELRSYSEKSDHKGTKSKVETQAYVAPPSALGLPSPGGESCPNPATAVALTTDHSATAPAFFRTVAQLGVQAAEALEHAHQLDIVHRDIKPANLLVDVRGKLWITDFGLAHCQSQPGLTMSGDLLGTLRYMSPEQALAKRVIVDQRTDIYSLGVTLYEWLTLEPVFSGHDRQEVLRQIAFEEPRRPRRLNKALPAELETIVLKAIEKNPADRYATAQDLADDLRRFLEDKPIWAKRPTLRQRAVKWAKRHQAICRVAVAALAVIAVGSSVSALIIAHQWDLAEQRRQDADRQRIAARINEKFANDERDKAKRVEAKAEAINEFLVRNILTFGRPGTFGYRRGDTTLAQVLDEVSRNVDEAFRGQPELEASVRMTIGNTFFALGNFKEAEKHLRKGLNLRGDGFLNSADPWEREYAETAFATKRLGVALERLDRNEEAKPFLLRGGEARRRVEIRRIPFKVNAFPFTLHPLNVIFSPDSRWLLVKGDDHFLRLYDVATGMEIHRFAGHDWSTGLAFSPDGRHALSSHDKIVRLLDVFTGKEVRQFTGHTNVVHFVAFSPDGRHALSASRDKTLRLWDVQSGREIRQFRGHTDLIHNASFSPDGSRILSASKDGTIRLWEAATGAEIRCFQKTWAVGGSVVFSPNGRRALSTHTDGSRLWDVETGAELRRIRNAAGFGPADFTLNGSHGVGSGDVTGKWWLFDLDTGEELRSYYLVTRVRPKQIQVSHDGRLAVCGNWRGSISIWRLADPPPMGHEIEAARLYYDQKCHDRGPEAPETLQALDELAALHLDRDEPGDAEPLFRQSLKSKMRLLGVEHPATLGAMKNFARVLRAQKKMAEAEVEYRQCLKIYRHVQGAEHPDVLVAMNDLADTLETQGKLDEAAILWRQCVEGWDHLLTHDHPETRAAVSKLVLKLREHGKPVVFKPSGLATGYVCAELGCWDQALLGFAKAFESKLSKDQEVCLDYACLLVQAGDTDGYRKFCARWLQDKKNGDAIGCLAHAFVLAPQADANAIVRLAEQRKAKAADIWSVHVLALANYRAGRFDEAGKCLSGKLKAIPEGDYDVANWLLKGLVEQRLAHKEDAKSWLQKADRWIEETAPKIGRGDGVYWGHWLMIQILHREAKALIRGKNGD